MIGIVPRMEVEGRGMIPEIEIKYEEFGAQAMQVAEQYLNVDALTKIAELPNLQQLIMQRLWKNSKI